MRTYSARGVHGQTVHEVAKRILSGRLPENAVIDLPALETDLGVSRTVMREALKVLAAKGMVDARQKRGTLVQPRDSWNLLDADVITWQFAERTDVGLWDDLHELRRVIEPAAAELAARRHTAADIAALEDALDRMYTETDPTEADVAFHIALLHATHNELLVRMEVLLATGLAARDRLVHGTRPVRHPGPWHRDVLDAVNDGDPSRAGSAMRRLLDQAAADLRRARRAP